MGCGELVIGDDVWIGHEVFISTTSRIEIGSYVDIAPMVYLGTGTHRIDIDGLHSAGESISRNIKIEMGHGYVFVLPYCRESLSVKIRLLQPEQLLQKMFFPIVV